MSNQVLNPRIDTIKKVLMGSKRQIESLLQDPDKANRFLAASLVVASSDSLKNCSPESIGQALIGVAMSDLNIDSNIGHCYLVPYKDKVQLQIGYKGFIQLLFRAGWLVKAFPVFDCDDFSISFDGWDNRVQFVPNLDDREEGDNKWCFEHLRGVYVVARHADTKDEYSDFINKSVIEKLRKTSPNQKISNWSKPDDKKRLEENKPIGIWEDWYIEMAKAKAVKKLAKALPIGDLRAQNSIVADDKSEIGKTIDYVKTADTGMVIEIEQAGQKTDYAAEKAAFKQSQKTNAEWQSLIEQCKTGTDLSELIVDMPETVQLELQEQIDVKFDLMK